MSIVFLFFFIFLFFSAPSGEEQVKSPTRKGGKNYIRGMGTKEYNKNAEWVITADPVARITGDEFKKSEVDLVTQVTNYFNDIGGKVRRDGFGDVDLTRDGVRSSIAHGIGRNKAAAFTAVPNVILSGKIIDRQTNYKNRGYDAYVIAAPIRMGTNDFVMEVIVNKDRDGQRFYLHEVELKEKIRGAFKTRMDTRAPRTSKLITAKVLDSGSDLRPTEGPTIASFTTK